MRRRQASAPRVERFRTVEPLQPPIGFCSLRRTSVRTVRVSSFRPWSIGSKFHEEGLQILHYDDATIPDIILIPGLTFTIEPMINISWKQSDAGFNVNANFRNDTADLFKLTGNFESK